MAEVIVHGPASWNTIVDLDELPPPQPHMRFAEAHREVLGGTSAGKATHLADLGVDVELHTVVGTDAASRHIESALERANVRYVATRIEGPSERHLNLMDRSGGRVSIYLDVPMSEGVPTIRSANRRLLDAAAEARAVVLDLSETSRALVAEVTAVGVPLWTDLHDYDGRTEFHAPFLEAADFVFMNDDRIDAPHEFLRGCIDRGAQVAVCTLGADGAVAVDAQRVAYYVPAHPVREVVDTNGAGDGFMAGFLAAHLAGAGVGAALAAGAEQATRALGTVELNPLLESAATA